MAKLNASNIKRLREAKGWSQAMLAERAILDPKTLSNALNGNNCQMKTVRKLAKALDVEPGDVLTGNEESALIQTPVCQPAVEAPRDQRTVEVQLILKLPASAIEDAGSIARLVESIASLVDAKKPFVTLSASVGSVILRLAMSGEDAVSLVRAAMQRKLRPVNLLSL